jgi:hypothetical protein
VLDTFAQIRLFTKLKLTKCARAGNRAGLFRAVELIGAFTPPSSRLCETHRFTLQPNSAGALRLLSPSKVGVNALMEGLTHPMPTP